MGKSVSRRKNHVDALDQGRISFVGTAVPSSICSRPNSRPTETSPSHLHVLFFYVEHRITPKHTMIHDRPFYAAQNERSWIMLRSLHT